MTAAPDSRPLPARLGAFAIAGVLGEGGSGIVYDATWGHRRVALKVLRDELLATARERERFLAEAELLQAVEHAGVVKVLGTGTLPDGRPYLAMEHLDGESLARRIARAPLALADALALFAQLADAVAALHARGLVHRDIKPENIFVVGGHAVLLDFGIAKSEASAPSTTTQEGSVRGTPAYMAPERFFGAPASTATDIYELAVVLYAMIAGRLPWTDVVDPAARLNPPRLAELGHRVPDALDMTLAQALSTRAEARPRSARELAERVRGEAVAASSPNDLGQRVTEPLRARPIASSQRDVAHDATAVATAPRARRLRWPWAVAAAGVLAIGGIVGAIALHTGGRATAASASERPAQPTTSAVTTAGSSEHEPMLDPSLDPWSGKAEPGEDHPGAAAMNAASTSTVAPTDEIMAKPIAVTTALASQLDLHPVDADIALVVSGARLRASAAMTLATKTSVELGKLDAACGFDLLASVDEVVVTGKVDGFELAFDVSVRGKLPADGGDHCAAVVFGGAHATTTADTGATRIEGGSRTVWLSHPDASTLYITTNASDHVGHKRDPSVRRGAVAKLVPMIDLGSALWLIGSPHGAGGELFPGVAPPRAMYGSVALTSTIDVRGAFRFADGATAVTASHALRGKLDELAADPLARGILGASKVGTAGSDATFSIAIPKTFASATLGSMLKYAAP